MAKKPSYVPPQAQPDEEMVVTVVRFRGSGESLRRGIDALTQAFSGAFGTPARQIGNGRKPAPSQPIAPDMIDRETDDVETLADGVAEPEAQETPAITAVKPKKAAKPLYTFMNDLNLSPDGKTAWKAYAATMNPDGFNERLLVASAWRQTEGGLEYFAGGELFTCFRAMEWTTQADMTNTMRKLKSTKSYYDNSEYGKWRLTRVGLDAASAIGSKA